MIRQSTIDKLHDLRLSAMSDAFECQCRDPETYQGLSFEDRFGMLVDKEWDKRKSTKLQKLIRSAEFRYPNACMEDIEYHPDRNLDKGQMLEFSTCRYISDDHHIILKGASGNGKTYIACALGIAACRNFIKVRYVRLPDLLNELAVAHGDGTLKKVIKAYQKIDLLILDSKSTFDFFGEMSSYPDPNRRYTMGLASIIYDVLDDYILHASIHKFLSSERAAALEHLEVLEDMGLYNNSIIIFDRGYYSEDMFRYCVEHGHLCVMRLKEGINLSKKCNGDMISILQGTSKEGTSDVPIRVLEIPLDDGTKEYLATNLFDPAVTKDMFRELYFYRWPVELKYKELKSRFAMEEFSGATAVSIQQEFYINMLLSNLASLIKNEADEEIQISAKSTNKFRYQANRAFIIGRIKSIVPKILCGLFELSIIEQLYTDAVRCRSQLLPGRSFPRKKLKSKGRPHFRNKKASF